MSNDKYVYSKIIIKIIHLKIKVIVVVVVNKRHFYLKPRIKKNQNYHVRITLIIKLVAVIRRTLILF